MTLFDFVIGRTVKEEEGQTVIDYRPAMRRIVILMLAVSWWTRRKGR